MSRSLRLPTLLAAALLALDTYASPTLKRSTAYDWDEIPSSSSITWTPCFDQYSCARLEVPIDYNDPSAGSTALAFIKLAAEQNPDTAPNLVINNGGPGQSGVSFLMRFPSQLREAFGAQYNLVSFDPRGVNNSGLGVDCFAGDTTARKQFTKQFYGLVSDASESAKKTGYDASNTYGQACSSALAKNTAAKYISTPAVAQDLLTYAQAENKALGEPEEEAKLWLYAMSYGTVIGTTFASLFPNNVGRLIMDGVFDDEDYYNGNWESHNYDSDKAVVSFAHFCHEAGQDTCAFWSPSPQKIMDRIDGMMAELRGKSPMVYSNLVHTLMLSVYSPLMMFPNLAKSLAMLEKGNSSSVAASGSFLSLGSDAQVLIPCIDSYGLARLDSQEEYDDYASLLISGSKYIGPAMIQLNPRSLCHKIDLDLPTGPSFSGSLPPSSKKTAFPILFTSNSIDPITPIRGAQKMVRAFPGSSLLTQESVGHTAISSASKCFIQKAQAYLAGTVPSGDVQCGWDRIPFKDPIFMAPM
ncbi:Alpha/Beta hydrolase protein [Aspergillus ambiguus]|uniref:alpha/beta hydrolase n=1 Tax=Aspergillus ambiguus TaxID=176160 RepID=UPI003CCD3897